MSKSFDELKKQATQLGLEFHPNISEARLKERVEQHQKNLEDAEQKEPSVEAAEEAGPEPVEEQEEETYVNVEDTHKGKDSAKKTMQPRPTKARMTVEQRMRVQAKEAKAAAEKTRIVTIIDNDQRVNNMTNTCSVNCSNAYFDLGTKVIPLNERVEVRQGHLDVLREVRIPQHIKSPIDPTISEMVMRPRYTIQYED